MLFAYVCFCAFPSTQSFFINIIFLYQHNPFPSSHSFSIKSLLFHHNNPFPSKQFYSIITVFSLNIKINHIHLFLSSFYHSFQLVRIKNLFCNIEMVKQILRNNRASIHQWVYDSVVKQINYWASSILSYRGKSSKLVRSTFLTHSFGHKV